MLRISLITMVLTTKMLRFFIVRNHYRSAQNYAPDNLIDAQQSLDRLYQTLQNIPASGSAALDWSSPAAQAFKVAMDDDFNTAGAVAALFDLASQANRSQDASVCVQLKALGSLLGLLQQDPKAYFQSATRYTRRALEQASALKAATATATATGTAVEEVNINLNVNSALMMGSASKNI
jgi:cysteinyl-tRNA synthetase